MTIGAGSGASASFEAGRLRKVSNGIITTIAGLGTVAGDGGLATSAQLITPTGLAFDNSGNLSVTDWTNNVVREISGGETNTVIGNRSALRDPGTGPLGAATLLNPNGVAVDSADKIYIADSVNERILEVSDGTFTTIASNVFPVALALDPSGNLYFTSGDSVDEYSNGNVTTIAGATYGYGGDNGPPVNAQFANPSGLAIDSSGNIYVADTANQRIRKISNGTITTIAGNGTAGFSGDNGPATSAQLSLAPIPAPFPGFLSGLAVDSAGNLYIADAGNQRIRMVSSGVITTIAGNGQQGFGGDGGPALNASFNGPSGIAISPTGAIYVADSGNGRVRALTTGCISSVNPTSVLSPAFGGNFIISVQTGPNCAWIVTGLPNWITLQSPPVTGPGNAILAVAPNTGPPRSVDLAIAGQQVSITQASTFTSAPVISLVANAFGDVPLIAPNTWVEIKGVNLAPAGDSRAWQSSDFINNDMPTSLDGVSVLMNGANAYVYSISPSQINVLSPATIIPGNPAIEVQVVVGGISSPPFPVPSNLLSPSFFVYNGGPYVIAVHLDGSRIGPTSLYPGLTTPAKPGETILLFANGFGPTLAPIAPGSADQSGALPYVPLVNINGLNSIVESASLISPGLFQFNVILPTTLPDGDSPIIALVGPSLTQPGTLITIQH